MSGGAGFVGSRIAAGLAAAGHDVVAFDIGPERGDIGVAHVRGDVGDGLRMWSVLADRRIEAVVHAAALADLKVAADNPIATVSANALGTAQVLEASRQMGVERVVCVSSEAVYGIVEQTAAMDESTPFAPISVYGASKAAGELLASVYRRRYGMDVVCVRLAEVYGPGLQMAQSVCDMVAAAVAEQACVLDGPRDQRVGLIHVDDVAAAVRGALEAATLPRPAYHVSDGVPHTLGTIAEAVAERLPSAEVSFASFPNPRRLSQPPWDVSAARADLGFTPAWTLEDALPALIEAAREAAAEGVPALRTATEENNA
ncbi:MAG: NAD(P)-dependent oxidoreductase [Actinobacteria bacterium]|nr:NAD(P)-dependent oxidoreductase [Actinomycetota bacterium]